MNSYLSSSTVAQIGGQKKKLFIFVIPDPEPIITGDSGKLEYIVTVYDDIKTEICGVLRGKKGISGKG